MCLAPKMPKPPEPLPPPPAPVTTATTTPTTVKTQSRRSVMQRAGRGTSGLSIPLSTSGGTSSMANLSIGNK